MTESRPIAALRVALRAALRAAMPLLALLPGLGSCVLQPPAGQGDPPLAAADGGAASTSRGGVRSGALDRDDLDQAYLEGGYIDNEAMRAAREAASAKVPSAGPTLRRSAPAILRLDAERALDDLHRAAREGDRERYLARFAPDAVFVGTDGEERWDMARVREYVGEYMTPGVGWPYASWDRHLVVAPGGEFAWFDERLRKGQNDELRGTGVLRLVDGVWLVAHYCMAYTIPSGVSEQVVEMVWAFKRR